MNQRIVDYLQNNKEKYSKEILVEQLKSAGYSSSDIKSSVIVVYNEGIKSCKLPPAPALSGKSNKSKANNLKLILGIGIPVVLAIVIGLVVASTIDRDREINNSTNKTEVTIMDDDEVTDNKNDLYINRQLGFSLRFPKSWDGYTVMDEVIYGPKRGVRFGFSQQNNLFSIYVYTREEWAQLKKDYELGNIPGSLPTILGENMKYIYAHPFAYEMASGLENQAEDINSIVASFSLTEQKGNLQTEVSEEVVDSGGIQKTVTNRNGAQITNYETAGNLQVTHEIGCVSLGEITNRHTPADIFPGFAQCARDGEYEKALKLYFIGLSYGQFDTQRVSDETAHQAISVLLMSTAGYLEENTLNELQKIKTELLENDSKMKEICAEIKKIGLPKYHPGYMISHGMGAFTGSSSNNNGLNDDFDAEKEWIEIIDGMANEICKE